MHDHCYAMTNLHDHRIVGHVHDELIIECPEDEDYHDICNIEYTGSKYTPNPE